MSREAAERLLTSPLSLRLSRAVVAVGTLNLVAAIATDIRTFAAPVGPGYEYAFLPSFLLIFPLWAWAVPLTIAQSSLESTPGFRWGSQVSALPRVLVRSLQAIGALAVVAIVPGISHLAAGQPHYNSATGLYTQNSHGSVTVVSRTTYEQAVAGGLRLFLCGAIIFSAIAVAVTLNHLIGRMTPSRRS
jgi:hypothetical protein